MREMTTQEVRHTQVEVLEKFADLCQTFGVDFHLAYGSLLGAVRHGGYIPWDDDVDVMMHRSQFQQFCDAMQGTSGLGLTLGAPAVGSRWQLPYAKLWDSRTSVIEDSDFEIGAGVGIDIFPIDQVPSTPWIAAIKRLASDVLRAVSAVQAVRSGRRHPLTMRLVLRLAKVPLRFVDPSRIARLRQVVARSGGLANGRRGIFVGSFHWEASTESLDGSRHMCFEGRKMPVPADSAEVLSAVYGDYMKLPPIASRVSHHAAQSFWINREHGRSSISEPDQV